MTSNKGFSLIETLIAIFVVVLSGVGTLKLYSYLEVEKANALMFTEAKQIAESQMALIQTLNTTGSVCEGKTVENIQSCVIVLAEDSAYLLTVTPTETLQHTPAGGVAATYAKVLDVKVSWDDRNGHAQALIFPVSVSKSTNLLN